MSYIVYENKRIELNKGQNVLSALLDHGYEIPNSCRAGACQSCMMQVSDGDIPESAQSGLKDSLKAQGYFLACCCQPTTPLHIKTRQASEQKLSASIIEHTFLSDSILRLRVKTEQPFAYHAGQFITLWMDDKTGRSYSLASVPDIDTFLELHIRRIENGKVSNWLCDELSASDIIQIQAATGNCFYIPGSPEQKLLLAGTGTGLAPLIGIARDAINQNHTGEIHLIHGARQHQDLYMHQTLLDMDMQYKQFHYHTNVLHMEEAGSETTMTLAQQLRELATDELAQCKIYLCGDAGLVNQLKTKMFLAGASIKNIYTDPFIINTGEINTGDDRGSNKR